MGLLARLFGLEPPKYTEEQYAQYRDGFATGFPLVGQPERPAHDSAAYKRGLKLGSQAFNKAGRPQIAYEAAGTEE